MQLTPQQKRTLQKGIAVTLCALLLFGCFLAVPYIASAIPAELAGYLNGTPSKVLTEAFLNSLRAEHAAQSEDTSHESDPTEDSSAEPEESLSVPEPPEDAQTVFADSFCWYEPDETPTLDIINSTSYKVNLQTYLERNYPITTPDDTKSKPLVLILHTHGSESYLPAGVDYYSEGEDFRSDDPENTVIAVGEVIAETLTEMGITVVHDKTMHDKANFNSAYTYSRAAIRKYLAEYPSIRYVLDIHRDSIVADNNTCAKTLTTIDGVSTAQIMLVVGTDENGASHSGWRKNLTVATHLADLLHRLYPTLSRPVNLRGDAFNQALSTGSLLVEVGSCGNTIEEAKTAGRLFATAFAVLLKEQ